MEFDLRPFLTFAFVTTFTPGPNNITCASFGVLYGYRRTLPFIFGVMAGFSVIMLASSWISATLQTVFPSFESVLRVAGALYILWLAYHTLRASYQFSDQEREPLGFANGALLQFLNPKGIIYGLILFTGFLGPITGNQLLTLASVVFLVLVAFAATSTWALFGAAIRRYMHDRRVRLAVNAILALLLVYTAVGILGWV